MAPLIDRGLITVEGVMHEGNRTSYLRFKLVGVTDSIIPSFRV
jgi:hypothetical protein